MAANFGMSVTSINRNNVQVAPNLVFPVYYIVEKPDGTFETISVPSVDTPISISVTESGRYGMYAMGSVDPGTVTSAPGFLPLPGNAVYPLKPNVINLREYKSF